MASVATRWSTQTRTATPSRQNPERSAAHRARSVNAVTRAGSSSTERRRSALPAWVAERTARAARRMERSPAATQPITGTFVDLLVDRFRPRSTRGSRRPRRARRTDAFNPRRRWRTRCAPSSARNRTRRIPPRVDPCTASRRTREHSTRTACASSRKRARFPWAARWTVRPRKPWRLVFGVVTALGVLGAAAWVAATRTPTTTTSAPVVTSLATKTEPVMTMTTAVSATAAATSAPVAPSASASAASATTTLPHPTASTPRTRATATQSTQTPKTDELTF